MLITKSYAEERRAAIAVITALSALGIGLLSGFDQERLALVLCAYTALAIFWGQRPEVLALIWLVASPVASNLLRFPLEQSLLTFDRAIVLLLVFAIAARVTREQDRSLHINLFEICWLLFSGYALLDCLLRGAVSLSSLKIAIDAFLLPLLMFNIARNGLRAESMKYGIFISLALLSYWLFPIGLYELISGVDLLQYPGADLRRDGLVRPNGPFLSDNSYALISLIIGLALLFWPKVSGLSLSSRERLLRIAAVATAILASLVPQFRAVGLTIVVCLALYRFLLYGWRSLVKPALAVLLIAMACLPVWYIVRETNFYQNRLADPTNAYSRMATYQVADAVIRENWQRGVGLGRYEEYFERNHAPEETLPSREELRDLPQSTPHNNLLAIGAELGIIGFALYALSNLLIIFMGFNLWRRDGRARSAGAAILTIWTAYTIVGLTLTSGYYGDLNLTFFFLLGILVNFGNSPEGTVES